MEKVKLTITEGFSRLSSKDENDCAFIQFEVDYMAEQEPGNCTICEKEIESGWQCLDGGEEYCNDCVEIVADDREDCEKKVTPSQV